MHLILEKFKTYMLLEGRIDLVKKIAPILVEFDVLDEFIAADPSPQKKYIEWMAKQVMLKSQRHVTRESVVAFINYLRPIVDDFYQLADIKKAIKEKDINAYESIYEIRDATMLAKQNVSKKSIEKQAKKDKIVIYEKKGDPWYVIQPTSHNASRYYGLQTKWCISEWDNPKHWSGYTNKDRIKFVFVINKQTNDKWCVAYGGKLKKKVDVYDKSDDHVAMFDIKKVVPPDIFNVVLDYIGIPNKVIKTKNKYGEISYTLYGKYHREDGPAAEFADGSTAWYLNGKYHRENGPAVEQPNGFKAWWLNGKLHRENGPAIIYHNRDKAWFINGKLHREDGPAFKSARGTPGRDKEEWWLNGQQYRNEQEWQKAKEEMGLK